MTKNEILEILSAEISNNDKAEKILSNHKIELSCEEKAKKEAIEMHNKHIEKNICQLEAIKMLFDINVTGSTHRQKVAFCQSAKKVIDLQISEVYNQKYDLTFPF